MSLEHWESASSRIIERARYLDDGWQTNFYFMSRQYMLRRESGRLRSCRFVVTSIETMFFCEVLTKSYLTESIIYDAMIQIMVREIHAS